MGLLLSERFDLPPWYGQDRLLLSEQVTPTKWLKALFAAAKREARVLVAKGPAYYYAYSRQRLSGWLGQRRIEAAVLDDRAFLAHIDLERPELGEVKRAAITGKCEDVAANLLVHFQTRIVPRFFFARGDIEDTISLIGSDHRDATIHAADEVCQNIFRFRGAGPVQFEEGVDWTHCPQGNIDWMWDLNRHAYFETLGRAYWYTGDERYALKFRDLLFDWLMHNPVGRGQPNWIYPFEVAFRINTWMWAFHYFRSAAAFDRETCLAFLKGLLAHGLCLDANLELHIRNNHLLLEAKALAMLGLLFPEFKQAARWRRRGLKILYQQVRAQVCSDGVHYERATLYHRIIAGQLLELLVLLENNGVPVPSDIIRAFERMVEFELWVTKPDGLAPLLGDSALKDTYLRFSASSGGPAFLERSDLGAVASPVDEMSTWLLGHERRQRYLSSPATICGLESRPFPEGGYFVMRQGQAPESAYLVFDCGPFVSGHSHADALSFELYAHGQTLLVDPGVYSTYLGQDWRDFFRGSRAHNTVVVDNLDQSALMGTWRARHPARVTLHQWTSSDHFDLADGSHDGYERLSEPITHRRQVLFVKPEYWVIIDLLIGRGQHCFDLYFHLMPGVDVQLEPGSGSLHAGNGRGPGLIIVPLAGNELQADIIMGATDPIQGWVSFASGEKRPAPTLRYRQERMAPVQFCSVLYPYPAGGSTAVAVSPLEVEVDGRKAVGIRQTGLQIETDTYRDYLVVDRGPVRAHKVFAGYETDARLVYLRHRKEDQGLVKVVMRGGGQLLFQGQSILETRRSVEPFVLDCEP